MTKIFETKNGDSLYYENRELYVKSREIYEKIKKAIEEDAKSCDTVSHILAEDLLGDMEYLPIRFLS